MPSPPSDWPRLTTERLVIRALTGGDARALWQVRSDPDVARYQTWSSFSPLDADILIASMRRRSVSAAGSWFQFAIATRSDDRMIGDLALRFPAADPAQAEIGFNIGRAWWRQGYGREALARFVEWLLAERGTRRIFAVTDERNHASRTLLVRCGFTPAPGGWRLVFFKGEWSGELVYERLAQPGALQSSPP